MIINEIVGGRIVSGYINEQNINILSITEYQDDSNIRVLIDFAHSETSTYVRVNKTEYDRILGLLNK